MARKLGRYAFQFEKKIYIAGYGNVVGKKEGQGPLGNYFDQVEPDLYCGKKTMEQAEVFLQQNALKNALKRAGLEREKLDLTSAGDLLNQCVTSAYSFRDSNVPYIGLYGACSTMALSALVAALSIEAGISHRAAAMTSSHFGTAERQYRFPLEYGGQRAPAAQHTVTASGAVILTDEPHPVQIIGGAFGSIQDQGVNDLNNMGGAMAPAALKLILDYLQETNTKPSDYDLILTGDLGAVGYEIVMDLARKDGVNLHSVYRDCGVMIYDREKQDMHAGGSGCGCSAAVLTGYVIPKLWRGELQNVLFLSTGALMSPTVSQQGETIPGIAHLLHLKGEKSC